MNEFFGRHAVVTLESNDHFITLRTLDTRHGHSCRMFIDSDRLYQWLDTSNEASFMDYDCGRFIVMHRRNDRVHVHQTWIDSGNADEIRGYTQNFDLCVDDLFAVLVTGSGMKKLVSLDSKHGHAEITITNCVHRRIGKLDKLHRRALSKALRDNFQWKDSHICLYADWDSDFAFVDERMSGGLCLHETRVRGKDRKFHEKLYYQVHT